MKPMVAATMMSMRGLPLTGQMDTLLLARAQNEHKPVVFLEAGRRRGRASSRSGWTSRRSRRCSTTSRAASGTPSEMLDAYIAGDEARMIELSDEEKADALKHGYTAAEFDQSMADMLYSRNASWIAGIEKMHAAGGGFIAVGAMHLVGPQERARAARQARLRVARVTP